MSVKSLQITSSRSGKDRCHTSRTHGLTDTLITAPTHHINWVKPAENPCKLTLPQGLKITLISYRHNLTQEALVHLFGVSQPSISRTINTIEKALEKILTLLTRPLKESLKAPGSLVVGGTLIPTWNWRSQVKTSFSGKHKRAGFNHQVICTLDGRLLAIADPLPGVKYDAHAFRTHRLDRLLDSSNLADKGYVGLCLATPTKRRPGLRLLREQKTNNRVLNSLRSLVERVIAQVKTGWILHTGFRRPLGVYGRGWCFWLRGTLLNKPQGLICNIQN